MDTDATLIQDQVEIDRAVELSRRSEKPPASVAGYTMIRSLGDGAFGSVWLAVEDNTGKQVAIKFYSHQRGLDWSLLSREVEKLAVLYTSRNIVRLIDVGWNSDPPYYVMEYVPNGSLASFLAAGPLPPREAVKISKSVLQALVHAHGSGILHCDLKPANVLLDNDFEPRVCDFGQSRLSTEQNPALGTMFYMAPEQADLHAVPDARWDVYALGALLYHMLCGEPPYRTAELEEAIRAAPNLEAKLAVYRERIRASSRPTGLRTRPGIDRRLAEIVERCLQIEPQKRFPNAQAVLDMLELRDRLRGRRPLIILGIVGPSLLLIGMAWSVVQLLETAGADAGDAMTRRALESDILSARIVAQSIRRDLDEREQELVEVADRIGKDKNAEAVRAAIAAPAITDEAKNNEAFAELNAARKESDERSKMRRIERDVSWFVTDASGTQKWRSPFRANQTNVPMTIGRSYAYRDYFHGRGQDYPPGAVPPGIEPIESPHLSQRFEGAESGRYVVALSVPIRSRDGAVLGVLARTIEISSLLDEFGRAIFEEVQHPPRRSRVSREIALVDRIHGSLLDHTWFDKNSALLGGAPYSKKMLEAVRVSPELGDKLRRLHADVDAHARHDYTEERYYVDPLGRLDVASADLGGEWLAAFAAVPGTDWVAVVEERRNEALEPVHDMKTRLTWNGWWALLASCGLIGLLWYFVGRALNERTPPFWAARSAQGVATNGAAHPSPDALHHSI